MIQSCETFIMEYFLRVSRIFISNFFVNDSNFQKSIYITGVLPSKIKKKIINLFR
jgi:hypothetical protein